MANSTASATARGFGERSVFWMILVAAVIVTALIAVVIAASGGGAEDHAEGEAHATVESAHGDGAEMAEPTDEDNGMEHGSAEDAETVETDAGDAAETDAATQPAQ